MNKGKGWEAAWEALNDDLWLALNCHELSPMASHIAAMTDVTVWHDGACPLCRREIALMRRLDTRRAIRFVDATTAAGCPIDQHELLARFHAREGDTLLSGAAAFAAMWRAIPLLRPLGLLARSPLVLRLFEAAYLAFLAMRPGLQRLARSWPSA